MVIKTNKGSIGTIDSNIIKKHARIGPYIPKFNKKLFNNSFNFEKTSNILHHSISMPPTFQIIYFSLFLNFFFIFSHLRYIIAIKF